ncbi:unnamed protein product [Pleuronectes platessa]|uniref:Uncharacterized protein n=1 Tax=Pleuronectes platessa TaxID=8262 RepID=A0A9N7VJT5_PLEPL|nr:unnamed protein product [Pleuronectes platessa]
MESPGSRQRDRDILHLARLHSAAVKRASGFCSSQVDFYTARPWVTKRGGNTHPPPAFVRGGPRVRLAGKAVRRERPEAKVTAELRCTSARLAKVPLDSTAPGQRQRACVVGTDRVGICLVVLEY